MDASTLDMVRSVASTRTYLPDEKVFIEGSPGSTMYVIMDGNVEISVAGKLIEIAGPGMIVGEMALIDERSRSASVEAVTATRAIAIGKLDFQPLARGYVPGHLPDDHHRYSVSRGHAGELHQGRDEDQG